MVIALLFACSFQPTFGTWTYAQTTVDVDSCGLQPYMDDPPVSIELVENDDGTFTIDDHTAPFVCVLDDVNFTCADRWPDFVSAGNNTLEADGEAHGAFDTKDVARGSQSGTFDCVDIGCETAAALLGMNPPCDLAVSFVLTKDEVP